MIKKLTPKYISGFNCNEPIYSLDEIRSLGYKETSHPNNCYLFVSNENENCSIYYGLFSFAMSNGDDSNIFVTPVFTGFGVGGLREARHTNFGVNGYLYYMPGKAIQSALKELEVYFDYE